MPVGNFLRDPPDPVGSPPDTRTALDAFVYVRCVPIGCDGAQSEATTLSAVVLGLLFIRPLSFAEAQSRPTPGHTREQRRHHPTMTIPGFVSSFCPSPLLKRPSALPTRTPACARATRTTPTALADSNIGIGVIGCGRIGHVHARTIAALNDADLVMVADPFEKFGRKVAAEFGTVWTPEWEDMLTRDDIQGIVIGSPTPFHADQIIRSAEAGKDIFCEKPISNELRTIDTCLDAVKANGVKLFVGFQRRFDANFIKVRDHVRMGSIGDVRTFSIVSRDPAPPPAEYLEKSGGIFLE